jgi:hypothetical protein
MRIKVINHTKDHKDCKFFIHLISQDSFTLFTNIKFTQKIYQDSKHAPNPKENSFQKKIHVQSHNYVSNSRSKIASKLHKVLQGKVNQKHQNVTPIPEVNFGMKPHPKR